MGDAGAQIPVGGDGSREGSGAGQAVQPTGGKGEERRTRGDKRQ